MAETLALTGPRIPVARWAYDALAPYAGLFVVEGICAAIRGPGAPAPGPAGRRCSATREAAAAHRAAALEQARALGAAATW